MNELEIKTKTLRIDDSDCETVDELAEFLHLMEGTLKEVVGIGLLKLDDGDANIVDYVVRPDGVNKEILDVTVAADETAVREKLQTNTPVQWAVMKINGNRTNVFVSRPGRSLVFQGKMSTFGGPNDTDMNPGEPLAIIKDADIAANPKVAALFQDGTGPALGRRLLNQTTSYIACRWDYKTTPRKYLLGIEVEVRNPATGKTIKARPADWGPDAKTNRVADLSDFAASQLGLQTNDICEVTVPLPVGVVGLALLTPATGAIRPGLVQIALTQHQHYHGINEAHDPLFSQIKRYYADLKAVAGNEFTFESATGVPWSAVFVCWCLLQAGVTNDAFDFSKRHSVYINKAIQRALANPIGAFPALDAKTTSPEPGDLIHWNRSNGRITYEQAKTNADYDSHCVIVVDVGEDANGPCVHTIGGNEGNSVGLTRLPLNNGLLVPRSENPYISIVKMG